MDKKRVLFVSQEIFPFLPKGELSTASKRISQEIQELGKEIRIFTPKYGCINERRHQLHEVIRLSGLNITINDKDHSLVIKVASVPNTKMQVYFTDNEEFFRRKYPMKEESGEYFSDNDERAIFFSRAVLETVKKLGWQPDLIHCHGWLGVMIPIYLKEIYSKDPHFTNTKVVLSLCNTPFNKCFGKEFAKKLAFDGISPEIVEMAKSGNFVDILRTSIKYSHAITVFSEDLNEEYRKLFDEAECDKLDFLKEEIQGKQLSEFFDKVINEESLVS